MKGAWKTKAILEVRCLKCDHRTRLYETKRETVRRRIRSAANQHALTHHPWMGTRERSTFADEVAEKEGLT